MELFKYLYQKNNSVEFDLTEDGKNCGFKNEKDMTVRSYRNQEFKRKISFNPEIKRIEII